MNSACSLLWSYDTSWWAYYLWVAAAVEIHLGMVRYFFPLQMPALQLTNASDMCLCTGMEVYPSRAYEEALFKSLR